MCLAEIAGRRTLDPESCARVCIAFYARRHLAGIKTGGEGRHVQTDLTGEGKIPVAVEDGLVIKQFVVHLPESTIAAEFGRTFRGFSRLLRFRMDAGEREVAIDPADVLREDVKQLFCFRDEARAVRTLEIRVGDERDPGRVGAESVIRGQVIRRDGCAGCREGGGVVQLQISDRRRRSWIEELGNFLRRKGRRRSEDRFARIR